MAKQSTRFSFFAKSPTLSRSRTKSGPSCSPTEADLPSLGGKKNNSPPKESAGPRNMEGRPPGQHPRFLCRRSPKRGMFFSTRPEITKAMKMADDALKTEKDKRLALAVCTEPSDTEEEMEIYSNCTAGSSSRGRTPDKEDRRKKKSGRRSSRRMRSPEEEDAGEHGGRPAEEAEKRTILIKDLSKTVYCIF
ncbi:uncharacterized protein LOC143924115 isoform X1 [Lithobates pipiens]